MLEDHYFSHNFSPGDGVRYKNRKYRRRLSRNESSTQLRLSIHWWTLLQNLKLCMVKFGVVKLLATIIAFLATFAILPVIGVIYICLRVWRRCVQWWVWYYLRDDIEIRPISITGLVTDVPLSTLLFSLRGFVDIADVKDRVQEIIDQRDESGVLKYPNLQRHLVEVYGYYAWKQDEQFNINSHVILGAQHFQGRSISNRNIQEYLSELCSKSLQGDIAPWIIVVIQGVDENGSPITWFVVRAHPLLVSSLDIQDLFVTKYPNPWSVYHPDKTNLWGGDDEYSIPILSAPAATKRLIQVTVQNIFAWLMIPFTEAYYYIKLETEFIIEKINDIVNSLSVSLFYDILFIKRQCNLFLCALQTSDVITHLPFKVISHFVSIIKIIKPCKQVKKCLQGNLLIFIKNLFVWHCKWLLDGINRLRNIDTEYIDLVQTSSLEIYWVIRAIVSLPRLLLEELILVYSAKPLPIWKRRSHQRLRNKVNVFWSEEVSLSNVFSVKGVTGASLSSVLLTATTGAVRDLVRACGIYPPEDIQCTLPLYTPTHRHKSSYGLLPLALPISKPSSNSALRCVKESLEKMRKYPERYLASIWLTRHIINFLPRPLRSPIFKKLSTAHPLLLTNIIAPRENLKLWGYDVTSVMFWRPPQHHAVISVCVSSYCDHVTAGVVVDACHTTHAHIIPQAFVTHLNELAVEAGVRLERKSSPKGLTRTAAPFTTPSSTPPSTPSLKRFNKQENYFNFPEEEEEKIWNESSSAMIASNVNKSPKPEACNIVHLRETNSASSVGYLPNHKHCMRRRKSDVSSNSWEKLKQTLKGL